ncbi:MAG: beta-propeller domain-containing protein [Patescibacteria group bacterium]|jgi:inhibitor of cysteine peptidase
MDFPTSHIPNPTNSKDNMSPKPIQKSLFPIKTTFTYLTLIILVIGIFSFAQTFLGSMLQKPSNSPSPLEHQKPKLEKFSSIEEFKAYLSKADATTNTAAFNMAIPTARSSMQEDMAINAPTGALNEGIALEKSVASRVSETNVQVKGIDEPDIVKTNGKQIFFSSLFPSYQVFKRLIRSDIVPANTILPSEENSKTRVISAFPVDELAEKTQLKVGGNLVLTDKVLVVISNDNKIYGYDIQNPENPTEKWQLKLEDNHYLSTARLLDNTIYLITQTHIDRSNPCPVKPLADSVTIACDDIYHPSATVPVNTTYTVMAVNVESGTVEKSTAFVGSSNASVIYMSPKAIYVSYSYTGDMVAFTYNFFTEKGSDLISQDTLERINKLRTYDISSQAKQMELGLILEEYRQSLSSDEALKFENEMTNRMEDYSKAHMREMSKTGIAKIGIDSFVVEANGEVPGYPLNQFSLDEHEDNLRIATTISSSGFSMRGGSESVNDVYVLNSKLEMLGSALDLGKGERIYSTRFIGDRGYVVTFKQIDPFYVLDLSNPKQPTVKGELKIPGYSSYLHSLEENVILGIGEEDNKVKLSVFNVQDPSNPEEISKYILDEYWSEAGNNHHAFLQDDKHKVFFLPGGKGGYVFSYEGNELKLQKAVSDVIAKRALYIDNYLYILAEDKVVVLDEKSWETVKELDLDATAPTHESPQPIPEPNILPE